MGNRICGSRDPNASIPPSIVVANRESSHVSALTFINRSSLRPLPLSDPLENCIIRVKQVIQKKQLMIPSEHLKRRECPVSHVGLKNAVETRCAHVFEQTVIQGLKAEDLCPLCEVPIKISELIEVTDPQKIFENWEEPVLVCASLEGLNPQLADEYLEIAQGLVSEGRYNEALKAYAQVFQYTNSSEIYSAIPNLYIKLEEPEKATLSCLYLGLYQFQEGKTQESIRTLKENKLLDRLLRMGLALQGAPSLEEIDRAMDLASEINDLCIFWKKKRNTSNWEEASEDIIFIYEQVIRINPSRLDAYEKLIPLLKTCEEKRDLLLRAADRAHEIGEVDVE